MAMFSVLCPQHLLQSPLQGRESLRVHGNGLTIARAEPWGAVVRDVRHTPFFQRVYGADEARLIYLNHSLSVSSFLLPHIY